MFRIPHAKGLTLRILVKISKSDLMVLTGKIVLLNSVQEFIEIEAWLLLTFFLRLHNQLLSMHSIVAY